MAILRRWAREAGCSVEDILGPSRDPFLVRTRHQAMHEVRKKTGASFPVIGRIFNRDHSSVIHAVKKVDAQLRNG